MKKTCLNPKCGKDFEPKNPKGVYCSPNCKAAHQYQLKKLLSIPGVTTASEIPIPEKSKTVFQEMQEDKQKAAWVKEVEDFCNKNNCTVTDLIQAYKSRNKSKISLSDIMKTDKKDNSGAYDRRKQELGF